MKFLHSDLGHCRGGEIVEVALRGNAANVFLVDSSNFQSYKSGRRYSYYGGHATRSPIHLTVPRAGRWFAVVDLGGYAGRVNASIRTLPGPLAPLGSSTPDIASIIDEAIPTIAPHSDKEFDLFICHATEDKVSVAGPLTQLLAERRVEVWYDVAELRVGDSLRRSIDRGLARSRFGLVVVSRAFFAKNWAQYELDGLVSKEMSDSSKVILPVWHEISRDEVVGHSPSLADKVALKTSDYSLEEIADELARVIHDQRDAA